MMNICVVNQVKVLKPRVQQSYLVFAAAAGTWLALPAIALMRDDVNWHEVEVCVGSEFTL